MKISLSKARIETLKTSLIVIPILEEEKPHPLQKKDMKGEFNKLYLSYDRYKGSEKVLLVGLGKRKDLDKEKVRKAFGLVIKKVRELQLEEFSVLLKIPMPEQDAANAATEGILLGAYEFTKYKTRKKEEKDIRECTLLYSGKDISKGISETVIVCENVNMLREMVNENADEMTTEKIAAIAKDIAKNNNLKIKVFEKEELEKLGCHLILAVGRGSRYPPRMVVIEYNGSPKQEKYAIVGKGITFDSGGINLKPTGYIETMKQDMAGAAVVLATIKTLAELHLKINIIGIAPLCENMIGPFSYKPGDIYKSFAGKSVHIESTDAEGRLVLADAIAYAEKIYKPKLIIDIATLTGASSVVFGEYITAMIGTGKNFMKPLFDAGEKVCERVWELPLYEEYKEEVKAEIADLTNLGYKQGRYAGTIIGAAFLSHFAEKSPLIHLDIGNTAWRDRQLPGYIPKNATGVGLRLLTEFFRNQK